MQELDLLRKEAEELLGESIDVSSSNQSQFNRQESLRQSSHSNP